MTVDQVGNMFARRPGRNSDVPPIAIGSHLDTQPTGGKFDGNLGVLGGLEVMRTLHDNGYETKAPIEVVNWTNEEGSRFAPAMLARASMPGCSGRLRRRPRGSRGQEVRREPGEHRLSRGGAVGARLKLGAMFELHIEQGPILEAEQQDRGHGHRRAGHALV